MEDDLFVWLDKSDEQSEREHFDGNLRYNRERRLENAPSNVRILHSPNYIKKQSFFASVMSNKGHRYIFFSIVILAILNIALYFYYNGLSSGKIDGIDVKMESFHYNGDVLLNLVLSDSKMKEGEIKEVKVLAEGLDATGGEVQVCESAALYLGAKLVLHFKMQEKNIKKIRITVIVGNKKIVLSKKV